MIKQDIPFDWFDKTISMESQLMFNQPNSQEKQQGWGQPISSRKRSKTTTSQVFVEEGVTFSENLLKEEWVIKDVYMTKEELEEEPTPPKERRRLRRKAKAINRIILQGMEEKLQWLKDLMNEVSARILPR